MKQISSLWQKIRNGGREKLVMLVLAGMLLLVIVWPVSDGSSGAASESQDEGRTEEAENAQDAAVAMEQRLTAILSEIDGAGKVSVMMTLKSSAEQVVEKDETYSENKSEQSTDSVSRSESTVYSSTSGGEPYVIKEIQPEVEGILVVAEGAGSETVVNEITYAVQVLFDVPVHKIKVVKMSSR